MTRFIVESGEYNKSALERAVGRTLTDIIFESRQKTDL